MPLAKKPEIGYLHINYIYILLNFNIYLPSSYFIEEAMELYERARVIRELNQQEDEKKK